MKIKLVGQASILVECGDRVIWTDPWLFGTAFNNSWRLMPEARFGDEEYERVTDLWISHEHPDHFHIPTLRSMPDEFKKRVTLWFQENNSDKVPAALRKFGFANIRRMPHRKWLRMAPGVDIYCAQIGQMDSSLAVRSGGKTILNLNDCEVNETSCEWLRKDLGHLDVVLNQFSCAGYSGEEDRQRHLKSLADHIVRNVVENHRDLGADVTIPFASYVYFCQEDNFYVNHYANTPHDVKKAMDAAGQKLLVLYPGDTWELGQPHDSQDALERLAEDYARKDEWPVETPQKVALEEIQEAFHNRSKDLLSKYPGLLLRFLRPVVCHIPDLDTTVRFYLATNSFEVVGPGESVDVEVNSQPLHFMFKFPWGLQTLGVSARLLLKKNESNWRRHRVIFAMNNAEVYLRPSLLLTRRNLNWLRVRLPKGFSQLFYQLRRMRPSDEA